MSLHSNRELFDLALSLAPESRDAWLAQAAADPEQLQQVRALLAACDTQSNIAGRVRRAADASSRELGWSGHLGPYRLLELLGEGGMGMVWKAERDDGEFRHQVAIKTLRGRPSPAAVERLRQERQILAGLVHPHIARLLDGGTTPAGDPYLVMEYIDGMPLRDWLRATRPSLQQRLQLFATLCRAVAFAHQRLVVHCDIKPGNVMVRADGTPVLLDFGVAQLVDLANEEAPELSFAGTPAYASPEQLLHQPVTVQSDVWGLGMLMIELLAGVRPTCRLLDGRAEELPLASSLAEGLSVQERAERLALDPQRLRGDLDSLLAKALRVEARQRYSGAAELALDLDNHLAHRPVSARGGHWRYLLGKTLRRHRAAVVAGALALAALISLSLSLLRQYEQTRLALAVAEQRQQELRGTVEFLTGMFSEFDPNVAPGRLLTPQALTDLAKARLDALPDLPPGARIELMRSLASIYNNIGANEPALELSLKLIELLQQHGAADTELASARLMAAISLERLGRVKEGLVMAQQAERGSRGSTDALLRGETLLALGLAWQNNADPTAAEASYAQAEGYFRQSPGGQAGLAKLLHNRGHLALYQGQAERALDDYREAVRIKTAVANADHPTVFTSRMGEVKALSRLGRYPEALAVLTDLIPRVERTLGTGSDRYRILQSELGSVYQDLGQLQPSRAAYLQAVELSQGDGHEDLNYAYLLNNLASLDELRGDTEQALAGYAQSLALRERLGADAVSLARVRMNMARTLIEAGQVDAAQALITAATAARQQVLAPDHPDQIQAPVLRLLSAVALGDAEGVASNLVVLRAALAGTITGMSPLQQSQVELAIARGELSLQGIDSASEFAASAHQRRTQLFPAGHPMLAQSALVGASARLAAGDHEQAAQLIEQAAPAIETQMHATAPLRRELARLRAALATIGRAAFVHPQRAGGLIADHRQAVAADGDGRAAEHVEGGDGGSAGAGRIGASGHLDGIDAGVVAIGDDRDAGGVDRDRTQQTVAAAEVVDHGHR
ncbi:MAG: protein kinase [Lysobacterales bacterium]